MQHLDLSWLLTALAAAFAVVLVVMH
jgi:hypothetical protein